MDGKTNGNQKAARDAQDMAHQQSQEQQETQQGQQEVTGDNSGTYSEEQIASPEARAAEQLHGKVAGLKAQGESDWIDFKLQLANMRNVRRYALPRRRR